MIQFSNAIFLKSGLDINSFPSLYVQRGIPFPEVVIVGKSNAGKSSLINHLTQKKDLAHVSDTPGKTQTLNFYKIDDDFILVDLPGYGFAKRSKSQQKDWASHLTEYLDARQQIKLILLLLDIRRPLSEEDARFIEWAQFHRKPILVLFSKADKLTASQKSKSEKLLALSIQSHSSDRTIPYLSYSIKETPCRLLLKNYIQSFLNPKQGSSWDS
jgi:GTP-binding protein